MTPLAIDVSQLPASAMDHRAPIWWGNTLLLAIESTMFLLLLASYFYLWQNFEQWPPPRVNREPILYDPVPDLGLATVALVALLVSVAPMLWASRASLSLNAAGVKTGLGIVIAMTVGIGWVEYHTLDALHFAWNDNAYASVVWTIVGLHLMHVIIDLGENLLLLVWVFAKGLDHKHARDIRVGAVYWYWIVAVWGVIYAVVFWGPRVM